MKTIFSYFRYSKKLSYLMVVLFITLTSLNAQNGIKFNSEEAYKGYTLCTAGGVGTTFLLDNCGKIVNQWSNTFPRHYCRLTDEGNLIYINNNRIVVHNWEGNTIDVISPNSSDLFLDYEVMKLENGNYLAAARKLVENSVFDEIGWDPNKFKPGKIDGIVEIAPNGNIVWEWNLKDHTIQDKIPSAPNYGSIKDHPELVDVNSISDFDWEMGESFMINGMDYNSELDQIVVSVRKVSEIMIIDHSTTTEEAKGSTGGKYGKGGDILYRWGNPQNYNQGTEQDRVLYYQHNPNWVKYGEHKGKIIMYNNGLTRNVPGFGDFSSVHIIKTPINSDGSYNLDSNKAYEPEKADVTIDQVTNGIYFNSGYTSGAQVLPNGNVYITVGQPSDFIEVTPDGTVAWEYTLDHSNYIFRTEKYAPDFPGFEGRDLTGSGTVEIPSSNYNCELFTSTTDEDDDDSFDIHFEPSSSQLTFPNLETTDNILVIKNMQGQIIQRAENIDRYSSIRLSNVPFGMYSVTIWNKKSHKKRSRKIITF